MATAPAQIPTSFGHELRACLRCRLVKTYDQVLVPYYPLFFIIVFCLQFLFLFHSSESQAVRTAHSLRWKKIMSVLLIALLPILMGLFISILFLQNPLHLWISRYSFCFSSSIWFCHRIISVMDPNRSWAARWLRIGRFNYLLLHPLYFSSPWLLVSFPF